jgi:hypothetical protein
MAWKAACIEPSVLCGAISVAAEFMVRWNRKGIVKAEHLQCLDGIHRINLQESGLARRNVMGRTHARASTGAKA